MAVYSYIFPGPSGTASFLQFYNNIQKSTNSYMFWGPVGSSSIEYKTGKVRKN
jgi:hypothetical protein